MKWLRLIINGERVLASRSLSMRRQRRWLTKETSYAERKDVLENQPDHLTVESVQGGTMIPPDRLSQL